MFPNRLLKRSRCLAMTLAAGLLGVGAQVHATPITYQVFNHADGTAISDSVDADGYMLRLDNGSQTHTFNANQSTVLFSYDPTVSPDTASISGLVYHNESGTNTNSFDGLDDAFLISVTFSGIHLAEEGAPWYGSNPTNASYDDMISDLLSFANQPSTSAETSHDYSTDVDRIYFDEMTLTLSSAVSNGLGVTYNGALDWSEHGPDFFMQYNWRLGGSNDLIGAAGWLEHTLGGGTTGTNDFLFTLGTSTVPEPASASMLILGSLALFNRKKRNRMA